MHLSDGILPAPALAAGFVLSGTWLGWQSRRLTAEELPRLAVMSSAFFVASLVHIKLGGAISIHPVLLGLTGILLGAQSMLAVALGLLLQAVEFGHGGLTALGVNLTIMGFPAVGAGWCYRWFRKGFPSLRLPVLAAAVGAGSALTAALLAGGFLLTAGTAFREVAGAFLLAQIPLLVVEAVLTGTVVGFLSRTKPELLPCE